MINIRAAVVDEISKMTRLPRFDDSVIWTADQDHLLQLEKVSFVTLGVGMRNLKRITPYFILEHIPGYTNGYNDAYMSIDRWPYTEQTDK